MLHRDVKPSNILINDEGQPMLSDFGVAKMLGAEETMDLTGTSVGVGTPYYMSPEQAKNKAVGPQSDVYSLGVILFEMVTGRKPYDADTTLAVLLKQLNDPIPNPAKLIKGLPAGVANTIMRALAKEPKNRFRDMHHMELALEGQAISSKFSMDSLFYSVTKLRLVLAISLIIVASILYIQSKYFTRTHNVDTDLASVQGVDQFLEKNGDEDGPNVVEKPINTSQAIVFSTEGSLGSEETWGTGSPIFDHVDYFEEFSGEQLILRGDVHFADPDGDAQRIEYTLISIEPELSDVHFENDIIDIDSGQQKAGASKIIEWKCGSTQRAYSVRLQAQIVDREENRSAGFEIVFNCR